MADEFGDHLFSVPTYQPKTRPDPAPSPPDEGVDPFGIPGDIPPAEPDQPEPVLLVPSPKPKPDEDRDTPADRDTSPA